MFKKIIIGSLMILLPFLLYMFSPVIYRTNNDIALSELLKRNSETKEFVEDYDVEKSIKHNMQLDEDLKQKGIPLLLQWDKRWGYEMYGNQLMAITGCGPTCMSMVLSYLKQDPSLHPYALAQFALKNGHYRDGTSWSFMEDASSYYGIQCKEIALDEKIIKEYLKKGYPIICSVRKGYFTSSGHFIVLRDYKEGLIYVNGPNSRLKSHRGYTFEELQYQIKNLWVFYK